MKILGIDHGTRTGYTVLKDSKILEIGHIAIAGGGKQSDGCLFNKLYNKVEELIKLHEPELLVVERPMDMLNGRTTKVLIGYYSMLHLLAYRYNVKIHEVYPTSMKKQITGNGLATKQEVSKVLSELYNTSMDLISPPIYYKTKGKEYIVKDRFYDESDSLALATLGDRIMKEGIL